MNLNDFQTLTIGGIALKKLVRASDGLVLFDKTAPRPEPYFALEYDGNQSSIFVGSLFAGFYGGTVEIDWGDGSTETVTVPGGGSSVQIRRDGISGTRTIRFKSPASFFVPALNSRTMLGIRKLIDLGDNVIFRNTLDSASRTQPGCFNWSNLDTIDLGRRTSVPGLTQNEFFDQNTNLQRIVIPEALESEFTASTQWNRYADKFVLA